MGESPKSKKNFRKNQKPFPIVKYNLRFLHATLTVLDTRIVLRFYQLVQLLSKPLHTNFYVLWSIASSVFAIISIGTFLDLTDHWRAEIAAGCCFCGRYSYTAPALSAYRQGLSYLEGRTGWQKWVFYFAGSDGTNAFGSLTPADRRRVTFLALPKQRLARCGKREGHERSWYKMPMKHYL